MYQSDYVVFMFPSSFN